MADRSKMAFNESVAPEYAARLREASADLQAAIADLTQAMVTAGAVEKNNARARFEIALANFSALIDTA
ncbi:MAG TPA: hypothetical protein VIL01_15220 [Thermomicrobiales bacterium]